MTTNRMHHVIIEHGYRLLVSIILSTMTLLWLIQDGFSGTDIYVMLLVVLYSVVVQFKGLICATVEKLLHWAVDYDKFD